MPRAAIAFTASRGTARVAGRCSCRSTGTASAATTPANRGTRSAGIYRPTSDSPSKFTHTSQTPSTSSRSRVSPSTFRPMEGCACTAAARAATSGSRLRTGCRSATATSTCCARRWPSIRSIRVACTSAPPGVRCTRRRMAETAGRSLSEIFRRSCPSKSKPCHDSESEIMHVVISEVLTTPSQGRRHKGSILVIDGEPASLKPLLTILSEDGYAVNEGQLDLESQLRFVKDTLPDLVLVDVRKPGMDGYRVCASLKNEPTTRAIPVIFISSIGRSINQAKALLSGAVDYVTDPFDAEEVLWRIETHISLRRLREYLESAARNRAAPAVAPNEDLERALQEIRVLTQVTGRKHAEEKMRQAARELKEAQEALQSSERNLSLMINAIPTLIHVLRSDGSVLYVNEAVLDYTGLTLDEVQKPNYRDRVFHPDDVERLGEERRAALRRAVPFDNEQRAIGKDGSYRWFLVRYNPLLDEQGSIDRWFVAAFDIEDRKRSEERRV